MKKVLAILISVLLLATMTAGCGDKSKGEDSGKGDGTTTAVTETTTTTTATTTATTTTTTENNSGGEQATNEPKALFDVMDLSMYAVEKGAHNEYADNVAWEATSYTTQGRKELDSLHAVMVEDFSIQLCKTTVQDMLDAGWAFRDSDTANLEVPSHIVEGSCTLYHKDGRVVKIDAFNNTKEEQALAKCVVVGINVSYDKYALGQEYVSFTVNDMASNTASYAAIKEAFGDFHRVSVNRCYQNGVYQSSNVTIYYEWWFEGDDYTVEVRFEDTAEGLKFGGISLRY